jgi:hypothetical protein
MIISSQIFHDLVRQISRKTEGSGQAKQISSQSFDQLEPRNDYSSSQRSDRNKKQFKTCCVIL